LIDVSAGAKFNVSAKTGGFALGSSQVLTGAGTVTGGVLASSGSHIQPGDGVGKLTLTGSLTLNDGALLNYELGAPASSDLISMTSSTLYVNGQDFSDFSFTPLSGFGVGTYTLIDANATSGSLGSNLTGIIGGYRGTLGIVGGDLVLTTTVVPEPGTLALLFAAGLGLLARARRRRR
jgi:hypothetical protein